MSLVSLTYYKFGWPYTVKFDGEHAERIAREYGRELEENLAGSVDIIAVDGEIVYSKGRYGDEL